MQNIRAWSWRRMASAALPIISALTEWRGLVFRRGATAGHRRAGGAAFASVTAAMLDELEGDPIFLPSAYWRHLNRINAAMIRADGIENFKRSLSQNYYTWLVTARDDAQYQRLLAARRTAGKPDLEPERLDDDRTMRVIRWLFRAKLTEEQLRCFSRFVLYVWDFAVDHDRAGLHQLLAEPEYGNPIRVWRNGKLGSTGPGKLHPGMQPDHRQSSGRSAPAPRGGNRRRIRSPRLRCTRPPRTARIASSTFRQRCMFRRII